MTKKELMDALRNVHDDKCIIVIIDGDTLNVDDVLVWDDVDDVPAHAPIELIVN